MFILHEHSQYSNNFNNYWTIENKQDVLKLFKFKLEQWIENICNLDDFTYLDKDDALQIIVH
jgi:hypothetical protein